MKNLPTDNGDKPMSRFLYLVYIQVSCHLHHYMLLKQGHTDSKHVVEDVEKEQPRRSYASIQDDETVVRRVHTKLPWDNVWIIKNKNWLGLTLYLWFGNRFLTLDKQQSNIHHKICRWPVLRKTRNTLNLFFPPFGKFPSHSVRRNSQTAGASAQSDEHISSNPSSSRCLCLSFQPQPGAKRARKHNKCLFTFKRERHDVC